MEYHYQPFTPLDETVQVPDPEFPRDDSGFVIALRLYSSVPRNAINVTEIGPLRHFFCLGMGYRHFYIDAEVVLTRLRSKEVRLQDFNALRANPNAKLFSIWTSEGESVPVPALMLVNVYWDTDYEYWDAKQLERWNKICQAIASHDRSSTFNVYNRFSVPDANGITLYFSPAKKQPDIFTEHKIFANRKLKLPRYNYRVLSLDEALENSELVRAGGHFLHFYLTWVPATDYQKLWPRRGTSDQPQVQRQWPDQAIAQRIQESILNNPPTGGKSTMAELSYYKSEEAAGERKRYQSQYAVMGGVSASQLAREIWGEEALANGSPAAEWLHRNAFRFGGLGNNVDLASSQTRGNLIFGTRECNTHMMRAENTISALLKADALISGDQHRSGTLTTTNLFKGNVCRQNLKPPYYVSSNEIPGWVDHRKYMWLSFGLKYEWTMPQNKLGVAWNAEEVFDPFSRYVPLRVEAHLDDALMNYVSQKPLQPPPIFPSQSDLSMAPGYYGLTVSPSTSYQEPTIVWNAAQHHLPHVQIAGSKVIGPAIAEEPAPHDESDEEQAVEVVGAEHLLSHVTEDKPVEAVRVVQFNLAAKQRQAEPLRSSAPAHLQAQHSLLGPIFAKPALDVPQEGFVVVGNINLFGVQGLSAKFEKWEGPAPSNVVVLPNQPISIERVTLAKDFRLSAVIPELEGTAFDTITFHKVSVYHQNYQFDTTKAVGWHFSADLVINESCGALREVLSAALGVSEPTLSVSMFLGADGGWNRPPSLHSFTLEGVFAGLAVKPIDGVVLSKIGVRLFGIRTMKYDPKPRSALRFGFSVFGSMDLGVPGSIVPLTLDYEIREYGGTLCLGASINSWKNPFGANGLELSGVSFSTSFSLSSPWKSLTFGVSANLEYEDVSTTFLGIFSPSGTFELQASIHDVTLDTIDTLFRHISGDDLALPDADVSIGTASLTISNSGFSIALDRVTIGDHTSIGAGLAITSHNVTLRGELTTDVVQFGDVELKEAFLQITFEKKGSAKNTDLIVGGKVAFSNMVFDAAVHLYKSPDRSAKSLEWTVLAALTLGNNALMLSKVVPELEGTPFDLALTQAVFVAASRDDPGLGNMITSGYSFHQGVQVCAVLGQINVLNSLMRDSVSGLTISAGWSKAKGFDLQVFMPAPTRLNLGNGVTTTPFTLSIATKPEVQLVLSAGLNVPVAHSPEPLLFTLSLGANFVGAQATGQMSGWWVNPLGISKNVKVGPNLGLAISVVYAEFLASGLPQGFAIQGGITIGKTQGQLALKINEDPMKELIYVDLESLNIIDLVDFASDIIDARIPDPPRDLLDFQKVQLYICPAGVNIGTTFYPQGLSFQSDVILFGKRADIKCVVDTGMISLKGGVDNFALGPLTVRGTTGPRAIIECELGLGKQHLLIDGFVSLFGLESTARIEIDILPTRRFDWFTQLKFTDILLFKLHATLVGSMSFKDLSDADFVFEAVFEQDILRYIRDELTKHFAQARRAAQDGIDAAQKDLDKVEAVWKEEIDKAQASLDEKKKTWDAKNESVTTESNKVIEAFNREIESLQNDITSAQNEYDAAMTEAQKAVNIAQRARAEALQDARHAVDNAKREMIDGINSAQRDVDNAEREFNAAFGSAHDTIEGARRKVQSLQDEINDVRAKIQEYENASWREFWKKPAIPGLYAAIGTLELSKAVADGALQFAQGVLKSANFISKETAFTTAKAALVIASEAGQAGLDVANAALVAADDVSRVALEGANATLEGVKIGVKWGALQAAKEALQIFKEGNEAAYRAAIQALVDLVQCGEYLAYNAARAGLDLARATTVTLEPARVALELAREVGDDAIAIGQWVVNQLADALDIRVVRLSGSLRGMVGADGSMAKPFKAHIEGVVGGKPFTLDGEFDPNKTAEFITLIFKHLWDEVKKAM